MQPCAVVRLDDRFFASSMTSVSVVFLHCLDSVISILDVLLDHIRRNQLLRRLGNVVTEFPSKYYFPWFEAPVSLEAWVRMPLQLPP